MNNTEAERARSIDFWLCGGVSVAFWALMMLGQLFRGSASFIDSRFQQIPMTFLFLSLFCNHPHFMSSYRMAYGKGKKFFWKNWPQLLLVPVVLVILFTTAFLNFDKTEYSAPWIISLNHMFAYTGILYRFGNIQSLGIDLIGVSVWLMYLTVGWHYSKQVFGCVMLYANYDKYPISRLQRLALKCAVFSIAFYSFCYINFHWSNFSPVNSNFSFFSYPVTELGLPDWIETAASIAVLFSFIALVFFVFYKNWREQKLLPSSNLLIPIIAFYIWWIPITPQKEFYVMMVPFFHSLQYLPFAFRIERHTLRERKIASTAMARRMIVLLVLGFACFEGIPGILDTHFANPAGAISFFTLAALVFINIHHFFIDSVLWRFNDPDIRQALLASDEIRRR